MRTRQLLLRALANDITVDIDEAIREIALTFRGGTVSAGRRPERDLSERRA
jgi:hypothetical protein